MITVADMLPGANPQVIHIVDKKVTYLRESSKLTEEFRPNRA